MTPDDLRSLRARLDLTQQQLADLLGVHQTTVARWETGRGLGRDVQIGVELGRLAESPDDQ